MANQMEIVEDCGRNQKDPEREGEKTEKLKVQYLQADSNKNRNDKRWSFT